MTKAWPAKVSADGVRVNAVAPGPINTPLVMALSEDWRAPRPPNCRSAASANPRRSPPPSPSCARLPPPLFVGQTLGPNSGDVML
jgi:3-oxoacyl-[acyl-carrier protein] reductase